MKKTVPACVAALAALSLAACGAPAAPAPTPAGGTPASGAASGAASAPAGSSGGAASVGEALIASKPPAEIKPVTPVPFRVITTDPAQVKKVEIPDKYYPIDADAARKAQSAWNAAANRAVAALRASAPQVEMAEFLRGGEDNKVWHGSYSLSLMDNALYKAGTYTFTVTCYTTRDTTYQAYALDYTKTFGFRLEGDCKANQAVTSEYTYTIPSDAQKLMGIVVFAKDPVPGITILSAKPA